MTVGLRLNGQSLDLIFFTDAPYACKVVQIYISHCNRMEGGGIFEDPVVGGIGIEWP